MVKQANNSTTVTVDIDTALDLRMGTAPSDTLYTVTSVEAPGANTLEWSMDGTTFYPFDTFTGVIRPTLNEIYNVRFVKVTGAASTANITIAKI